MASRVRKVSRRPIWLWLAPAMAMMTAAVASLAWWRDAPSSADGLDWVVVRRDDLETTLVAGGDLAATRQVTVACQVEDIAESEGTMILTMIDNGSVVKKGDVLCRLDSSQFEEMARQQEIQVNQARALSLQARLVLETARMALREYQEGLVNQFDPGIRGPDRPGPIGRPAAGGPARLGRGHVGQGLSRRRPTLERAPGPRPLPA